MNISKEVLHERMTKVRQTMSDKLIDILLVAPSTDLLWLTGVECLDPDGSIFLVIERGGDAVLVAGPLEAPGIDAEGKPFRLVAGGAPTLSEIVREAVLRLPYSDQSVVVSNQMTVGKLFFLKERLPGTIQWSAAGNVISRHRRIKSPDEVVALQAVASAIDAVVADLQAGLVPLLGRTEKEVARDIADLMRRYGHDEVKFTIVASGANAAKPHHVPGDDVIGRGILLLDIGGTMNGYNSDTTRCLYLGAKNPPPDVKRAWRLLTRAQQAAFTAVRPGIAAKDVDAAARSVIESAGCGDRFVHSTGHGIGLDVHEAPSVSVPSGDTLEVGDVFSIEPGVYFPGKWGLRLEDIVVLTADGPRRLNRSSHKLVCLPSP